MDTMYPAKINSPATTLAGDINDVVTTIPLTDASVLPDAPNLATIGTAENAETILYIGKSVNDLTGCTRGFQGTAKAWDSGTKVARMFTAYDYDTLRTKLDGIEAGIVSGEDILVAALGRSNFTMISTNAGWIESLAGSGVTIQDPTRLFAATDTTANSKALLYTRNYGFNEGGTYYHINWGKALVILFNLGKFGNDSESVARFQLKPATAEGVLAAKGIGLKVTNLALWGEAYGTSLGEVDLNTIVTSLYSYQIKIILIPGTSVKWYVNGTLVGTQSDTDKIPSGLSGDFNLIVASVINGATGGVNCGLSLMHLKIWQAR